MNPHKRMLPHIGMRIIKTSVAVGLCYFIYEFRGDGGMLILAQLAALMCVQTYTVDTKKSAIERLLGTIYGAGFGFAALVIKNCFMATLGYPLYLHAVLISVMIIVILYYTVHIGKKEVASFSCVVFLCIVGDYITEVNPYMYTFNRLFDTSIGIVVGVVVNQLSLPKKRQQDTLFISGLDDILFERREALSNYSKVELNRMLDRGMNFTISTVRTPAAVEQIMQDVRLKLPIIALDGALLYDMVKKEYKKVYVISGKMSGRVTKIIHSMDICCFRVAIIEDLLIIFYDEGMRKEQKQLLYDMKLSPTRNYVCRPLPEGVEVVYFLVYDERKTVEKLYKKLHDEGFDKSLKITMYDSVDKEGYSYLKIFNKNANKANMIEYLKESTGIEKTVTFGSIDGAYDVVVRMGNVNKMIHTLKRLYEPVAWIRK